MEGCMFLLPPLWLSFLGVGWSGVELGRPFNVIRFGLYSCNLCLG
jgi:hypothetical protein